MIKSLRDIIWWSPTRYDVAKLCPNKYLFQYYLNLRMATSDQAMGTFLHRRKEGLYQGKPGEIEFRPKQKSAQAFANSARGTWKRFVTRKGEINGQKIQWKYKGQQWSNETLDHIEEMCIKTYEKCANEEPPLYVEYLRRFQVGDFYFYVKIDEIRRGGVIRDYKTGLYLPSKIEIAHNPQLTFYALAFCCFAYGDDKFARTCGVGPEDRESFGGHPHIISEKVKLEIYNLQENTTLSTTRNNKDYFELVYSLDTLESRLKGEDEAFPNWGIHCNYCQYKIPCDERSKNRDYLGVNAGTQLVIYPPPRIVKYHNTTIRLNFPRKKRAA